MLNVSLQRWMSNLFYRCQRKQHEPCFALFTAMYNSDSTPFSWIHKIGHHSFLTTSFISTSLSIYSGLELAAFNQHHLACYWLPGVKSQAKGRLPPIGHYDVVIRILNRGKNQYLHLEKTDDKWVQLKSISEVPQYGNIYTKLPCNLLNYALFKEELNMLIKHWLQYQNISLSSK